MLRYGELSNRRRQHPLLRSSAPHSSSSKPRRQMSKRLRLQTNHPSGIRSLRFSSQLGRGPHNHKGRAIPYRPAPETASAQSPEDHRKGSEHCFLRLERTHNFRFGDFDGLWLISVVGLLSLAITGRAWMQIHTSTSYFLCTIPNS